jgi:hypothetical protein
MESIIAALGIKGIIAAIIGALGWVVVFIKTHQDEIKAIVLRIEKDAADGWTNQEKEDLAVEIFFKYSYPKLPFYIQMIPNAWLEGIIRKIIRGICEKSHALKDRIAEIRK